MNIEKKLLTKISYRYLSEERFKKKIFNGDIFIIKKSKEILEIIKITEKYFYNFFEYSLINNAMSKKIRFNKEDDKVFKILQSRVKNCKIIRERFSRFLSKIGLKSKDTFMDMISLRFSPMIGEKKVGNLSPTHAHRDTWASNIFNQINFWFPIQTVQNSNSIFLVPKYFKQKIENNSQSWNYSSFKRIKNYPSVPIASGKINKKDLISFKILKGEILCFSGNHLHGSNLGEKERINLETRITCRNDIKNFDIPKNIDSFSNFKKNNWFKNLDTGENY